MVIMITHDLKRNHNDHKNLPSILCIGKNRDRYFLIDSQIRNTILDRWLKNGPILLRSLNKLVAVER